jgi:hypothetical protein
MKNMKRTILAVLMVVMVATPCLAQELEPEGNFSIEGTRWIVGDGNEGGLQLGFYQRKIYWVYVYEDGCEQAYRVGEHIGDGGWYLGLGMFFLFETYGRTIPRIGLTFGFLNPITGAGVMFSGRDRYVGVIIPMCETHSSWIPVLPEDAKWCDCYCPPPSPACIRVKNTCPQP